MQNRLASNHFLVFILAFGVFGIINTEMGVVGIIPQIAQRFDVSIPTAGWTVSVFALIVSVSAPILPMLFSGVDRKRIMVITLSIFFIVQHYRPLDRLFWNLAFRSGTACLLPSGLCGNGFHASRSFDKRRSITRHRQNFCRCFCGHGTWRPVYLFYHHPSIV